MDHHDQPDVSATLAQAREIRRRWLAMMGLDESEIDQHSRDDALEIEAELAQLQAMERINHLNKHADNNRHGETAHEGELVSRFLQIMDTPGFSEESLSHLSDVERVIFLGINLDMEVCNGGLPQWFTNSSGAHWNETIAMCETIGAGRISELLRVAAMLFPNGPAVDLSERRLQIDEMTDEEFRRFRDLEEAYFGAREEFIESIHRVTC